MWADLRGEGITLGGAVSVVEMEMKLHGFPFQLREVLSAGGFQLSPGSGLPQLQRAALPKITIF